MGNRFDLLEFIFHYTECMSFSKVVLKNIIKNSYTPKILSLVNISDKCLLINPIRVTQILENINAD
jgi:hypothetical protein